MHKNEERQFEHEARRRDGMQVLGKASSELTENRLYSFAKILKQKALGRRMRTLTVRLASRNLLTGNGFDKYAIRLIIYINNY